MEKHLRSADILANLLDNSFNFFGHRFGLNGLLGLIPGAGDIVTGALSLYIVWIGVKMRLPLTKLGEMVVNVAINFFIGLVPVLGDAVDFFHKGNLKNLKILKDHADRHIIDGEIIESAPKLASR